jgi:hypothetical protein
MEEMRRQLSNCRAQMYNMGTVLRHESDAPEKAVSAENRVQRAAPAVDGGD